MKVGEGVRVPVVEVSSPRKLGGDRGLVEEKGDGGKGEGGY